MGRGHPVLGGTYLGFHDPVAFYLTQIKPDKVDKAGSDVTDPVPELVQLLRATDKAPSDAEVRREAAAELTRLAQEMGFIP